MDVAHAILLYGKIDFSRLTADYLSAKFEIDEFKRVLPTVMQGAVWLVKLVLIKTLPMEQA